jgi:hypothetical protein
MQPYQFFLQDTIVVYVEKGATTRYNVIYAKQTLGCSDDDEL